MTGLKVVIFDMDGLMIDSEPIWHKVEQAVFASVGINLSVENCIETTGLRVDEVVTHHLSKRLPSGVVVNHEEVCEKIIQGMVNELKKPDSNIAMKGLKGSLEFFKTKVKYLCVASSSPEPLIYAALEGLGLVSTFQVICSATKEEYGKPHPAVYLSTLKQLNHKYHESFVATECLALEDSLNGLISAKAARMKAIAIPDLRHIQVEEKLRFSFADVVLGGLDEINDDVYAQLL